jgi:nicotinamide riboside transporter PnuC
MLEKNIWKTSNFWIETVIFFISVVGSIFISYGIMQGFLLWFVSNIICILYFSKQKQYPLALQSVVFLITTILGIVNYKNEIFYLK